MINNIQNCICERGSLFLYNGSLFRYFDSFRFLGTLLLDHRTRQKEISKSFSRRPLTKTNVFLQRVSGLVAAWPGARAPPLLKYFKCFQGGGKFDQGGKISPCKEYIFSEFNPVQFTQKYFCRPYQICILYILYTFRAMDYSVFLPFQK